MTTHPDRDITRGEAVDLADQAMTRLDEVLDKAWQEGNAKLSAVHNKPNYTDPLDRLTAMVEQIIEAVTDHEEPKPDDADPRAPAPELIKEAVPCSQT